MGKVVRLECPKCPWSGGMNDAVMRDLQVTVVGLERTATPTIQARVIKGAVPTCPKCGEDVMVVEVDDEEDY